MTELDSPMTVVSVSPGPGHGPQWRKSVETDLAKVCAILAKAHEDEAEATMAVFLAGIEYDASVSAASNVSKMLKEAHQGAMKNANDSEHHIKDLLEGDVQLGPIYTQTMQDYATKLKERSATLYTCYTRTLATRHLVSMRARKLSACKKHLVTMVEDRSTAESEVERISGIYAAGLKHSDDLLEEQLAFVRDSGVGKNIKHTNTELGFLKDFEEHCKLFSVRNNECVSLPAPSSDPVELN